MRPSRPGTTRRHVQEQRQRATRTSARCSSTCSGALGVEVAGSVAGMLPVGQGARRPPLR